jgi:Pectate lyase superfamily protein
MKTTLTVVLFLIAGAGSGTIAQAVCVGASVNSFGAKGDGVTDDTAAIRSAINPATAAGGGFVVLSVARYFTASTLTVPAGVVLCGPTEGPFDPFGINPTTTAVAATLLITTPAVLSSPCKALGPESPIWCSITPIRWPPALPLPMSIPTRFW